MKALPIPIIGLFKGFTMLLSTDNKANYEDFKVGMRGMCRAWAFLSETG